MVNRARPKNVTGKRATGKPARGKELAARDHQMKIQQALYEIADAASGATDMQSFYRKLHEIVGKLMHARTFYVTLYDAATRLLSSPYFADENGDEPPPPTQIDETNKSLRAYVLLEGRTFHLSGAEIEEGRLNGRFRPMGTPAEDWIGVPLKMDSQVIGSLTVQSYERGFRYEEQDVQLLEFVAQHIAVALTRARAIEETRQRNTELAVINSVQEGLASNLDIQSIYTLVGDKLREIFKADTTFIAFRDEAGNLLHVHYYADRVLRRSFSRPYRTGIAEVIINSGTLLLLRNELEQQKLGALHVVSPGAEKDLNQSVLGVPIFRDGKACGAVTVQSYQVNAFDENDLRLLQTLTNAMSVALENARLFDETQQRNAELAVINSVQEGLASKLDFGSIIELVGNKVLEIFNADVISIGIYDRVNHSILYPYVFDHGQRYHPEPLSNPDIISHLTNLSEPKIIHTYQGFRKHLEEWGIHNIGGPTPDNSHIILPIRKDDQFVGSITIAKLAENAFSGSDVRLLQTLANSMSVALENARLFDETQQRNAELTIINSVQAGLASKLEMQGIYDLVGDKIREIFDANTVALATFDLEKGLMHRHYVIERHTRYYFDPMPIPNVWVEFIRRGQSVLMREGFLEVMRRIDPTYSVPVGEVPKSVLSVPLRIQGETRGVISLQNVDRENAFSESDLRLLETLANSMSVALENARLWEQEKRYRKALERELEIGREIQAGFLPEELPVAEGWEIAASLMSAREVAGDFYDAFELPDGNIGLVIADVCDKGVGAALFMTLFRSLIRITSNREYFEQNVSVSPSTAERLQRAMLLTNNYIAETHQDSGMFATLFFGILDPRQGKLTYVNGGHEPPLIIQSGTVRQSLCKTGPAVGAILDRRFDVQVVELNPGEMLFAFTDGAPEAKDPHGEFFGRERLLGILQQYHCSSHELVKTIELELHQYMGSATQFDDITLLAVRRAA